MRTPAILRRVARLRLAERVVPQTVEEPQQHHERAPPDVRVQREQEDAPVQRGGTARA